MSKSQSIRRADLLALMRHLADVAALHHDPNRQCQSLIDGLNGLLGTHLGWWFAMHDWRPGRSPGISQQVLTRDPDPEWVRYMNEFLVHFPPRADPYADHSIRSEHPVQVLPFRELIPDKAGRRKYADTLDLMKRLKICDGIVCGLRIGPGGDHIAGFSLQQHIEAGRLPERKITLAKLALGEIARLVERGHLVPRSNSTALPPRLSQVLDRLLRGQSPRQIAFALGISIHTVREHIARLYKRLGVNSREDLMAKFVR